ncbi:MAG TPA: hypothetical protein VGK46_07075 [Saprospiraceae bacterium]|jgi:hypothetical protein
MNDPELKAMASVYDALQGLDAGTRKRVTDWVLAKLQDTSSPAKGAKRGRKPGTKNAAAKKAVAKSKGAKRGRKPGAAKATTVTTKKTGKRGRPPGSTKKSVKVKAAKKSGRGRGRPRKAVATALA